MLLCQNPGLAICPLLDHKPIPIGSTVPCALRGVLNCSGMWGEGLCHSAIYPGSSVLIPTQWKPAILQSERFHGMFHDAFMTSLLCLYLLSWSPVPDSLAIPSSVSVLAPFCPRCLEPSFPAHFCSPHDLIPSPSISPSPFLLSLLPRNPLPPVLAPLSRFVIVCVWMVFA